MLNRGVVILLVCLGAILPGCAVSDPPEFTVPPGRYAAAFEATREVLRDYRFTLDRVDAAAGFISTQRKPTSGLATPWDTEQTTIRNEFEDLLNQQSRAVRVTFRPASQKPTEGEYAGSWLARVEVIVYRTQSPGVRPSSKAVGLTTTTIDPVQASRGAWGAYEVPVSQDSALASRLARAISQRTQRAPVAPPGPVAPAPVAAPEPSQPVSLLLGEPVRAVRRR
jgi:hypothetical protein